MYLAVKYDRYYSNVDSAHFYYDWLQRYKPNSEQALTILNRYSELKNTISILREVDSIKANVVNDTSGIVNTSLLNDSTDLQKDSLIEN